MIVLLLLVSAVHSLNPDQKLKCSQNDGSDKYKYDLTALGTQKYKVTEGKYIYNIAICGADNVDINDELKADSIIQTSTVSGDDSKVVARQIATRHGGEMWVSLVFTDGDHYNTHCNGSDRKAQLLLICDPLGGLGAPVLIEEANKNVDYCYYVFEWTTNVVCPKGMKLARQGMRPSLLVLIILGVGTAVYLVLGVAYRRFVTGARGMEQVPNLEMWRNIGEFVADGANSICRCREGAMGSGTNNVRNNVPARTTVDLYMEDDDDEQLIQ